MGLLRKAIILGGLLYMLPAPPSDPSNPNDPTPSTLATMEAAGQTMSDVKGFCARQPQACEVGQYLLNKSLGKIKYSTQMAYDYLQPKVQTPSKAAGSGPGRPPQLRLTTLSDAAALGANESVKR